MQQTLAALRDAATIHCLTDGARRELELASIHLEAGGRRLIRENCARVDVLRTDKILQKALDDHVSAREKH